MREPDYDSRPETMEHIGRVRDLLARAVTNLVGRAMEHDNSKLEEPELSIFNEFTPKLRDTEYGSEEYQGYLNEMGTALAHHYEVNDHHPEHTKDGIAGMSMLSLIEALCDWRAAGERHADGDMARSLELNRERFGIEPQLYEVLCNTARELGLL